MEKHILKKMFTKIPNLKKDKVGINEKFCKLRVRFKEAHNNNNNNNNNNTMLLEKYSLQLEWVGNGCIHLELC
jgi:hypothetical protein